MSKVSLVMSLLRSFWAHLGWVSKPTVWVTTLPLSSRPGDGSSGRDGVEFRCLSSMVEERLAADERANLGSTGWYTTTVKLDLEAKGEIERVPGSTPQRLRRPKR